MWFSVLIMAFIASIDSLGIGIAYAIKGVKVPAFSRIVIVILSIIYTFAALLLGRLLAVKIPAELSNAFGLFIVICIGLWIIFQAFKTEEKSSKKRGSAGKGKEEPIFRFVIKSLGITIQVVRNPEKGDIDHSGTIDLKESIMLSIALSVDGVGIVLGGVLLGIQSLWVPLIMGLAHYITFTSGYALFKSFNPRGDSRLISALPGIVLIMLVIIKLCI